MCAAHGLRNPCTGCASDHLAGEHAPGDRCDTCRKCRAACRKPTPAPTPAPARKPTPAMPDFAALAANDTDYLEED
jgi:hypothetical protein